VQGERLISWIVHATTTGIYGFIVHGLSPSFLSLSLPLSDLARHSDTVASNYRIYFFEDSPSQEFISNTTAVDTGTIRINVKKTLVVRTLRGYHSEISRHFYLLGTGL
jgi:hypothetical protein